MTVTELFAEVHSLLDEQNPDTTKIEINVGFKADNISLSPDPKKQAVRVEGWERHKHVSLAKAES